MPPARASHAAVWTGERVLLWGGQLGNSPFHERLATGAAYDPILDVWSDLPESPLAARDEHVMVWTGSDAFVWGGYSGEQDLMRGHDFGDGARIVSKRR